MQTDEILNFLYSDNPHILCLSEHHLNQLQLMTVHLVNYTLGASYCRCSMKRDGVCISVHRNFTYSEIDLKINILKQVQSYYLILLILCILYQFTEHRVATFLIFLTKLKSILNLFLETELKLFSVVI
jgi:hypothetical protein